jgi:hypothetical protein
MSKESEYRANAANTIELAGRASSIGDKGRLLELVEKWLNLANRAHEMTSRFYPSRPQHPLLQAKKDIPTLNRDGPQNRFWALDQPSPAVDWEARSLAALALAAVTSARGWRFRLTGCIAQ